MSYVWRILYYKFIDIFRHLDLDFKLTRWKNSKEPVTKRFRHFSCFVFVHFKTTISTWHNNSHS